VDGETVFDYFVNPDTKTWELWAPEKWEPPKRLVFSQLLIPTSDSTRAEYIVNKISHLKETKSEKRKEWGMLNTLLVGGVGTAKTSTILMYANKFDAEKMLLKRINFSFYTQPYNLQDSIDAEVERKNAKLYKPPGDKTMTIFLDDMSMPQVNEWGDQITLEITRQLMDHKGYYFLDREQRGMFKNIMGLQFVAAMGHPGNGRNDIPNRLKRLFFSLNMTPISTRSVENIYGKIIDVLFKRYP
jgi:dynein heavy chain